MKAADRLGAGTAFAAARNPRNLAKAQASGDIPLYDLVTLPLDDVAPTPLNPRINFGSADELLAFGQGLAETQLQPCVAVPAGAYLRLWPEHTEQIGAVGHVLINGERRWRGAREAGLEKLDFTLRTDLTVVHDGDTQAARARLLDAVLKENIDRKNFDPIEEARGVANLVAAYGDGVRAGQQLKRGKAWVSQRLTLLALPQALQDDVSAGRVSIEDARWMGARAKKTPELSGEALLQLLETHQEDQRRSEFAKTAAGPDSGFTAVNPVEGDAVPPTVTDTPQAQTATHVSQPTGGRGDAEPLPRPEPGFTAVNPDASNATQAQSVAKPQSAAAPSADRMSSQQPASSAPVASQHSSGPATSAKGAASIPHQAASTAALPWSDLEALSEVLCSNLTSDELDELLQLIADRMVRQNR